jgi:FG-GAP repeat
VFVFALALRETSVNIARFAFFGFVSLTSAASGQQSGHAPGANASPAWVQLAKLYSPTASGSGTCVAIGGNVVVVGAPYSQFASVYVMPSGGWGNMVETAKLIASDEPPGGTLGDSVAISGNTIVVGDSEQFAFPSRAGAVYVFVEPAGGWTGTITQTAKLTASDALAGDGVGAAVSISGNIIIAGAPYQANYVGAAYVFTKPAAGWTNATQTAKLTSSDGQPNEDFGVSVSSASNVVVAGSPYEAIGTNQAQGAAYVYVEPATGWTNATQTAKLTASDGYRLGTSVSLSGNILAAGAPGTVVGSNPGQGAAYVFVKPAGGWVDATQGFKLTALNGNAGDVLGTSVAASGNIVVSGAPWFSHSSNDLTSPFFHEGIMYVFVKPAGGWVSQTQANSVTGSDARFGAYLGTSVAINGNTAVAGATLNNYNLGAGYVFSTFTGQ